MCAVAAGDHHHTVPTQLTSATQEGLSWGPWCGWLWCGCCCSGCCCGVRRGGEEEGAMRAPPGLLLVASWPGAG
jgi:hypothetical protein